MNVETEEKDFWVRLEFRVCREMANIPACRRLRLWCDGFLPETYRFDRLPGTVTGDVWVFGGRSAEWTFKLTLPFSASSRSQIARPALLPPDEQSRWLAVDPGKKTLELDLSGRLDFSVMMHDRATPTHVATSAELDRVIESAAEVARISGRLNLISINAPGGNALSMVVGGAETALGFTYAHGKPPYYASRGATDAPRPVMTCYVGLAHHTEFPGAYVIPHANGLRAAHEFALSGSLPSAVEWVET